MRTEINKELVKYAYENLANIPKGEEYEKCILGVPYKCFDYELYRLRIESDEKALDYGNIRLKDFNYDIEAYEKGRKAYLETILGRLGLKTVIEHPFFVDYGCNISIGDTCYFNFNCVFLDCSLILIGNKVQVGPGVTFTCATHPVDPQQRFDGVEYADPITVEDNVWIGAHAVILNGVTVGENSVIGAGAMVNKLVPPNSVVAGVPARVIKKLKSRADREEAIKEFK